MSEAATRLEAPRREARRSQQERSASTRGVLVDATLQALTAHGYAGATTAVIERRAGVSRGARLHHFPTKAALMRAAVERLYADIASRYGEEIARLEPGADRFREGLRLLWQTFTHPAQAAVTELTLAARHDEELREQMQGLTRDLHVEMRAHANEYFPNLARREANGLLETLLAAMRGLALQRAVHGASASEEQVLDLLEQMVKRSFASPGHPERLDHDPEGNGDTHE